MEWLPDISINDYGELARTHSPRVAEVIAVHWPEPDLTIWYCSTQAETVFVGPGGANLLAKPLEVRFAKNQFLDLPIEDGISDSQIKLDFWDVDGAIADLHARHGAGVRVEVYYWFPDESYFIQQWHGHLGEPEEEDGEFFRVSAAYGFRSALQPLPRRPFYSGCQAVYPPGRLFTQAEIDDNDCDVNLHLPGGTTGVPGALALGDCPRRNFADCIARRGNADRFLGFNTPADTYPNAGLVSNTRGNENNLKRPLRVVNGPYRATDLDILGFAVDENTNNPEAGWVWCLVAASEGVVQYITNPLIDNKFNGYEHFRSRTGERGQTRTDPPFSPNAGNYSGTAYFVMRVQGDYRNTNGSKLSAEALIGPRMNIRQWTDADTFTDGPTHNRAWFLLDALRDKRWGHGISPDRLVIQDWIDLAAWCAENVEYTDADGNTYTSVRSTFIGELLEKSAQRHIYEICLAGNFSLPFPHRGKTRIMGLTGSDHLEHAPVFSDEGEERNIIVNERGNSLLKTWKTSDRELPNRLVVTFKDRDLDNSERPLIFEDVTQQLKAGRAFGDNTRRVIEKTYDLLGVDDIGQAIRMGNILLDNGPLAGTTDEGSGLVNNRRVKFTTWFTQALNCHKYQLIKVISRKLRRYQVEWWRIANINRLSDLKVEIEAVAHPADYYATQSPLALTTTTLPDGTEDAAYSYSLMAAGGTPAYTWAVDSGTLPDGLTLDVNTGVLSGTPTTAGSSSFSISVTDSMARSMVGSFTLVIAAAPPPAPPGGGSTLTGLQFEVTNGTLPISLGLPVAEAENLLDTSTLILENASNVKVSTAFGVRERWHGLVGDTSKRVKVLTLDFTPNGTGVYTVKTGTGNPAPTSALTVTNNAGDYRIQTGNLDLKVAKTGTGLLTSYKLSTVEQLSGTLPTITATVPVKSRLVANATGVTGSMAADAGQNFVTAEAAALFAGVTSVKFDWTGTYTGLNNGQPKAITYTTANPIEIGNGEFSPDHRFIFDPGGANEYILTLYDFIWKTGFFARATTLPDGTGTPLDTFPTGMPLNVTIKDKEAIDAGNYTISSISGSVINLSSTLSKRLLKNVTILPVSATSPVTATVEMQSATIREQNAHRVIIQQTGYFKLGGSRLFADLSVELYWEFFAGHSFAKVEMRIVNANQTMPANVYEAQWDELKFNFPLAVTATASSDEVLVNDGSGSACARRLAGTSDSTAAAGSFKFTVANLAENFPSKLAATTSQITWSPFTNTGTTHTFPKDRAKVWQFFIGAGADTAVTMVRDYRVKLNAAYVAASGVVRRAFSAPRTWVTNDWQGDSRAADAANRMERQLKVQWDKNANDVAATLQWSHFDRELSSHTHPGSGNDFGKHFGVFIFGNTRSDVYSTNHYDFVFWLLTEGIRNGDPKAWRLAFEHAIHQATLGTILSAVPNGTNETYNKLGGAVYESTVDGLTAQNDGYYTHFWIEGLYLAWMLTGSPWIYDTLLLCRAYARRGVTSNLAATFEDYNEGRGLAWTVLALLAAYRHFGDVADLNYAVAAADQLRAFEENAGSQGVFVAAGYTSPSSSRGKQVFNSELCGYAGFALAELLAELDAKATPNIALRNAVIRGAKWAARGLATLNNAQGNQPVVASVISGGNITPAIGRYDWFQSGLRLTSDDSMVVGMLAAAGLLTAAKYGNQADLKALALDLFKAANLYQDSDARTARPIGTYDTLSYRRSQYYLSSDKVHRQTLFACFPFLAAQLANLALNPPAITSLSPSSFGASATGSIQINGSGFVAGAQVSVGGYVFTPAVVSATAITLPMAANLFTPGAYPVMVSNANGGQSNLVTLTIT